jgi:hypothetical protein
MGRYVNVEYRSFLEAYTQTNIQLLSNESNNGKNITAERKVMKPLKLLNF